jgi:hypothetical protein
MKPHMQVALSAVIEKSNLDENPAISGAFRSRRYFSGSHRLQPTSYDGPIYNMPPRIGEILREKLLRNPRAGAEFRAG